jgi:predicted nucleotidyltransferase
MRRESSSSVRIFYPKFDKEQLIRQLRIKIKELAKKIPLSLVILFGSYAHRSYTVDSDADLLVVYKGKEKQDAFAMIKKLLDISLIEPHVHSEDEYEKQRGSIDKITAGGVVSFSSKGNETK